MLFCGRADGPKRATGEEERAREKEAGSRQGDKTRSRTHLGAWHWETPAGLATRVAPPGEIAAVPWLSVLARLFHAKLCKGRVTQSYMCFKRLSLEVSMEGYPIALFFYRPENLSQSSQYEATPMGLDLNSCENCLKVLSLNGIRTAMHLFVGSNHCQISPTVKMKHSNFFYFKLLCSCCE